MLQVSCTSSSCYSNWTKLLLFLRHRNLSWNVSDLRYKLMRAESVWGSFIRDARAILLQFLVSTSSVHLLETWLTTMLLHLSDACIFTQSTGIRHFSLPHGFFLCLVEFLCPSVGYHLLLLCLLAFPFLLFRSCFLVQALPRLFALWLR